MKQSIRLSSETLAYDLFCQTADGRCANDSRGQADATRPVSAGSPGSRPHASRIARPFYSRLPCGVMQAKAYVPLQESMSSNAQGEDQ